MSICLLTCTGDRPEAFALCERWISKQTIKPNKWIVVDDGQKPTICTQNQSVFRRKFLKSDPSFTLILNLRLGLREVVGDYLLPIEDDDWYAPTYIERMVANFDGVDLVGEKEAFYYYVGEKLSYQHTNTEHASLCQTGIRTNQVSFVESILNDNDYFLDTKLWQLPFKKRLFKDIHPICIGIKGMPGRGGITKAHYPHLVNCYQPDTKFRTYVGNDADLYEKFAVRK